MGVWWWAGFVPIGGGVGGDCLSVGRLGIGIGIWAWVLFLSELLVGRLSWWAGCSVPIT